MSKGIKKVAKVVLHSLLGVVFALILLILGVALTFSLPRVQTFAATELVEWLTAKAGVRASIDAISISALSRVNIEGLYIEDLDGDTLLYASTASAVIDRNALFAKRELKPADVKVDGASMRVVSKKASSNIDELIRHIESLLPAQESKDVPPFEISGIELTNSRFRLYSPTQYRPQRSGVNYADMDIAIERAECPRLVIEDGVVEMELDNMHFADKSGAVVDYGRIGVLTVGLRELTFDDIYLKTMGSTVDVPRLAFDFEDWRDWNEFETLIKMYLKAENSTLTPQGLMAFVPDFFSVGTTVRNFEGSYDGVLQDFWIDARGVLDLLGYVKVSGRVVGVMDIATTTFEVDHLRLNTTTAEAGQIYSNITSAPLPESIARWTDKFEQLAIELSGGGSMSHQDFDLAVATDKGDLAVVGSAQVMSKQGVAFNGVIEAKQVELGRVLDVEGLGAISGRVDGELLVAEDYFDTRGSVVVDRVAYGGYEYRDIRLDGGYVGEVLKATLTSADPNMALNLEAECDMSWLVPNYSFVLGVERADFAAVGLSGSNPVSRLSCSIEATGEGASLDELEARAMVNNLLYYSKADTLSTELINIVANNTAEGQHALSLYSPLVDLEYRSKASYNNVIDYFGKRVIAKLPLVKNKAEGEMKSEEVSERGSLAMAEDFSTLMLNIKSDESLLSVFVPGVSVAPDSSLRMEFAPSVDELQMQVDCGYFEMNDLFASEVMIDGTAVGNRVEMRAEAEQLLALGANFPQFVASADCTGGEKIGAAVSFDNSESKISAHLEVNGSVGRDAEGAVMAEASVDDSWLKLHDQLWEVGAQRLYYVKDYAVIKDFAVLSGLRRLYVDGEIGSRNDQSLKVELYDLPLGEIVGLLADMESVSCRADGSLMLSAATSNPFGNGRIDLTDINFNGVDVEPLYLNVGKVQAANVVALGLINRDRRSSLANVSYNLKNKEFDASVTINEIELSLADALLGDVVSGVEGMAAVDLDVVGGGERKLTIDGRVGVESLKAKVGFTGVEYQSAPFELNFVNNRGELADVVLRDGENNTALLNGFVDMSGSELAYGLHLMPNNLMVIDLSAEAQSPFYGNVYASGAVSLSSAGNSTNIEAALTTGDGSVFCLPLQGNSDFAGADFVQFVSAAEQNGQDENDIVATRKLQFEGKSRKVSVPKNTNIDAQLRVGTNTELRLIVDQATDNVLVARGEADMNITLDSRKEGVEIRGDYQIAEGVYNFNFQNIISKQFDINQGSYIRWNGSPLDATLDVAATYKLKTSLAPLLGNEVGSARSSTPVECIVNLGGKLSAIDLSFDINVPTANAEYQSILSSYFSSQEMMATQFVYLLALGSFYSDSSSSTQGTSPTTAGTAIGLDFLATQVSKLMSNDSYKFKLKYNAIDDTSSSYGVDFQTEIIDDRLLLELEANVDTGTYYQTINPDQSQLSGGGSLTLLLDKAGDFILKGFSRTIDRFDENQGLQENGVGLYYRRSFDKFSDLWHKKAKKAESNSEKSTTFANPSEQGTDTDKNK